MPDDPTENLPEKDDMEYKPWVKYTAWGVLGVGCLAMAYYAFYSWGYANGSRAAAEMAERSIAGVLQVAVSKDTPLADVVAQSIELSRAESEKSRAESTKSLNEKKRVEKSLAGILRVPSGTNEALLNMAAQHKQVFSGIVNAEQRREAQGMLLSALLDRGLIASAEELLDEAMPPAPTTSGTWAQRMLRAAHALASLGKWEKARAYLQALDAPESPVEPEVLLRSWADMALAAKLDALDLQRELTSLAERAAASGNRPLAMEFAVSLAHVSRDLGDDEMAAQRFREAVQTMEQEESVSGSEALLYGVALCEAGHREQAIQSLTKGLEATERNPIMAEYRAMALRHLATLSMQRARYMAALCYLYRAQGEATGIVEPGSDFWTCLADQMAWTLHAMHEYEDALSEFRKAVSLAGEKEHLRAQPLEGAALCCLALGRSEEAVSFARDCAALREEVLPHDKVRLGLVYLLLGQACDQAGQLQPAADAYSRAASLLPVEMAEHAAALENRALVYTQMEAWESAVLSWDALIAALPEDATARREAARKQLETCRQKINLPSPDTAPDPPKATSAARSVTRRRSRH